VRLSLNVKKNLKPNLPAIFLVYAVLSGVTSLRESFHHIIKPFTKIYHIFKASGTFFSFTETWGKKELKGDSNTKTLSY
jgi:hypothetical protein